MSSRLPLFLLPALCQNRISIFRYGFDFTPCENQKPQENSCSFYTGFAIVSSDPKKHLIASEHDITHLTISVPEQKMQLRQGKRILAVYSISTSKFGLGFREGSLQTPLGRFYIHAKIGVGAPLGEIFRGRQPTGVLAVQGGEEDLITTRILWLGGLDEDNANTQSRYIYIHGTNQEHLLGIPASHGCIRMKNTEICELFDRVHTNDQVFILNTSLDA